MAAKRNSPYKKASGVNASWVPYCNIAKLVPNKAYLMLGLSDTNHSEYGPGQQATLMDSNKKRMRSYLPGKYLASLQAGDIAEFKSDISAKRYPFLVFRGILVDNSYHIDIIPYGPEIVSQFQKGEDVPALEGSFTEGDDPLAESPPFDDVKDDGAKADAEGKS